jgi:hypothetical protein
MTTLSSASPCCDERCARDRSRTDDTTIGPLPAYIPNRRGAEAGAEMCLAVENASGSS